MSNDFEQKAKIMKKIVVSIVLVLVIMVNNTAFAGWDIRLGITAGTNFQLNGNVNCMFKDLFKSKLPEIHADNIEFPTPCLNFGVTAGMEFMLNKKLSWGYNLYLGYQQEKISVDMSGNNFGALGSIKMNGISVLPNIYLSYYMLNYFSLNVGAGLYYETAFSGSSTTEMTKGTMAKNDYEGSFSSTYALGVHANVGITYHINNHAFVGLTAYCNAVNIASSNKDMDEFFEDLSGSGSSSGGLNPGGSGSGSGGSGGFNPGGGSGGGFPGFKSAKKSTTVSKDDKIDMNYISNGLWYQKDVPNRLTILFTIGYRF